MLASISKQTIKYHKNILDLVPSTLNLIRELNYIILSSLNNEKENTIITYKQEFLKKVSSMFLTTPYVMRTEIQNEFFEQDGTKFLIRLFKHDIFATKQYSIDTKPGKNEKSYNNEKKSYFDPFAPPFKDNFVVEENFFNLNTHRIFFSKYPVMDEHILIVTREFSSQYNHLNYDDIKNAITLSHVMNGIVFFNAGKKAGASQIRKHLQCIPLEKLHDKNFGLFLLISNEKNLTEREIISSRNSNTNLEINLSDIEYIKEKDIVTSNEELFLSSIGKIFSINQFTNAGINHVLIKFSEDFKNKFRQNFSNENIDVFSKIFFELYNMCLVDRGLVDSENEESVTKDYSFLFTDEWMLIVPRRTHEVHLKNGILNINSIGFLLMFMCNKKELVEEVKNLDLLKDVFAKLTQD